MKRLLVIGINIVKCKIFIFNGKVSNAGTVKK